ncbi:MAG: rod shape-determining protein RodA [Fimbriimonadales bacterium]|nr:rod shape-determining protein RodA [Fimbriimonadales bacterium]
MAAFSNPLPVSQARPRERGVDWWLVAAAAGLLLFGLFSQFSLEGGRWGGGFAKQLAWLAVGAVPFAIFLLVSPHAWRRFGTLLYLTNVGMLALVLAAGSRAKGAQRWIEIGSFQFQPSEMAKILLVITLANFFHGRRDALQSPKTFALSFLHALPILLLVFRQPHLGATIVLFVIWLAVAVGAGVPMRYVFLTIALALGFLAAAYVLRIPGVFKEYQMGRVQGLLGGDEQKERFQTSRAEIAFGVGGLTGVGFLNGEQKAGGFIPEQDTDFVFTVVGEEGGFVGCLIVLALYGLLFARAWWIMFRAKDPYDQMLAAGVLGLLAFHTIVNLSMNLQLIPVVGLWLPFLSRGGTALWLCLSCVALLLNIHRRQRPLLF